MLALVGLRKEAPFERQISLIAAPCIIVFVLFNEMIRAIDGFFQVCPFFFFLIKKKKKIFNRCRCL